MSATATQMFSANLPVIRTRLATRLAQSNLVLLLCLSITAPVFTLTTALPWFKVEQLALPIVAFLYLWLLFAGRARPFQFNGMFLIGASYALSVGISILYGSVLLGHSVIIRDFYEIPKVLLPVAFFIIGSEARMSEASLHKLFNYLALCILFVCFYAWTQWMDLGISHFLSKFYSGGAHIEGALSHYRRVYSTMGNPNVLGQLMTLSIIAYALAALFQLGSSSRNFAMILACLVTLGMTGSRYGLVNTGLGLAMALSVAIFFRRRFSFLVFTIILFCIFGTAAYNIAGRNQATSDRFQTLRNPLTTDSLRTRVDVLWRDAEREFSQSPFFGHGPAKAIFSDVVTDSEYLDVLKEFGILGFFGYLAYYLFPLKIIWKGIGRARRINPGVERKLPATFLAMCFSFLLILIALVMNIGMSTFYNPALQGFLWFWMGIGVSAAKTISLASHRDTSHWTAVTQSHFPRQLS